MSAAHKRALRAACRRPREWPRTAGTPPRRSSATRPEREIAFLSQGFGVAPPWATERAPSAWVTVVYTMPAREERARKLCEELGALCVVDDGRGITENALAGLALGLERAKALPEHARRWVCIVEDDVTPARGLREAFGRVLDELPADACGFSLHSDSQESARGWRRRYERELLRTQFAGFRVECVPELIDYVRAAAAKAGPVRGTLWDSIARDYIAARKLPAYVRFPSLVQHDCFQRSSSVMGHMTRPSPTFTGEL